MSVDYSKYEQIWTLEVEAEKSSCYTGKTEIIQAELGLYGYEGDYFIAVIKGGVTGFEYFTLKLKELQKIGQHSWQACCGRKGEWDKLIIPENEMMKLYNKLLLTFDEA